MKKIIAIYLFISFTCLTMENEKEKELQPKTAREIIEGLYENGTLESAMKSYEESIKTTLKVKKVIEEDKEKLTMEYVQRVNAHNKSINALDNRKNRLAKLMHTAQQFLQEKKAGE